LFVRWLWATTVGWWLGFVVLVGLAAFWDLLGGGAQFMVGVGMGFGVGFVQSRVLKGVIASPWGWCAASTFGMGSLFVLYDLLGLFGFALPFSLPLFLIAGGLLVGLLQGRFLQPFSPRAPFWVPACMLGWLMPAALIALGDSGVLGEWGSLATLSVIFLGGIPVGGVTGAGLVGILPYPPVEEHAETLDHRPAGI